MVGIVGRQRDGSLVSFLSETKGRFPRLLFIYAEGIPKLFTKKDGVIPRLFCTAFRHVSSHNYPCISDPQ